MALNKFMHPRNIYKNPPDFAQLAKSYEEFSSIVKKDITGKITIDFKDPHSLRVLTKYLLKNDFNLDVAIPEDRLVPTLPLRLNYILWIEDLLTSIKRTEGVWGLDIGTGACAVYPLLAAVKNKWQMIGTESDEQSLLQAKENVIKNNLAELIELKKNPTKSVMKHLLAEEEAPTFDFSMCNPPFYSNIQELCESRSPARLPPKNGFTGSPQELITEGGELAFCRTMIQESKEYKRKVIIFTTMVGHKYNLKELAQDLKAEGIMYTCTEFCQGRVTRWGLAWTFQDFDISQLVPGRDKPRKKNTPIPFMLPRLPGNSYDVENVSNKIKSMLQDLKIEHKVLNKRGNHLSLDIKALENTWSNQRRKRRLMKRLGLSDSKKPKLVNSQSNETQDNIVPNNSDDKKCKTVNYNEINKPNIEVQKSKLNNIEKASDTVDNNVSRDKEQTETSNSTNVDCRLKSGEVKSLENNGREVSSTIKDLDVSSLSSLSESSEANRSMENEPVVHAFLKIFKKENDILLEMEFLDGTAGKEGLHQIVQYIKNNWK